MNKIKPNSSLQALMQDNQGVNSLWEQADNEVRMLVNVWATMEPNDRKNARKLIIDWKEQRNAQEA